MGADAFFKFTRELFSKDDINEGVFRNTVEKYLPGISDDLDIWLTTSQYPERFRLGQI